jgi:hypothetical protein
MYTIFCTPPGDNPSFPIDILPTSTVGHLKDAIWDKLPNQVDGMRANHLRLYRQVGGREEALDRPRLQLIDDRVFGRDGPPALGDRDPDHIVVRLPESEPVQLGGVPDNVPPEGESVNLNKFWGRADIVPTGFQVYKEKDHLTALYEGFWGQPRKLEGIEKGEDIEFSYSPVESTSRRLYFFEQYAYLRERIDACRGRDPRRPVIVTGTPGIGTAFYLLSPSD